MSKKSLGPKTLALPAPVWVVGTYDAAGKANGMTAAWGGVCCSKPPCVSVALRPSRYSYDAIVQRRAFTVCVPSEKHLQAADYFGLASGRDEDKFAAADLTPVRSELVDAPYVEEFPLALECRLLHTVEVGLHTLFIGEILDVKCDEQTLTDNGEHPDLAKVRPVLYAPGSRRYFGVGELLGTAYTAGRDLVRKKP
ncbi:MAG: flavin reductase family protein [Candidatus Zixiibacteriota bacterium]|nr:MAG: flavin reductase family protein [candidate division Zixibacteria bacterium]